MGWLYPALGDVLYRSPPALEPAELDPSRLPELTEPEPQDRQDLRRRAEQLAAHRFTFLNLPAVDLGTPPDWGHTPDGHRLWHYNLHYGEWALTLARAGEAFVEPLLALIADWIAGNPAGHAPAWDPYPISRRLVAWSRLPKLLAGKARWQSFWPTTLEPSLRRQARFLAANLEHDVPNNHLLANYRALAQVGLLFDHWPEHRRWRRRGLAGLWREMGRQVLADGVHSERSTSYHTIVLQDLLETWRLARRCGVEVPGEVAEVVRRMLGFLAATRTPSGGWPMVNDSVPGYPTDPAAVLDAAAPLFDDLPRDSVFPDAGYAVLRDEGSDYLFFDAGAMGPPQVLGHGHADALAIELHGGGRPLVVDPGVETYENGAARDRCRGTRAHNTVTVDGEDQCVFWGPFRVAHPARARLLETSAGHLVGEHRGYLRLAAGVVHRRRIEKLAGAGAWEIHDRFEGTGEHQFAFNLQLAPGCRAAAEGSAGEATWPDGVTLEIRCLSGPAGCAEIVPGRVARGWNLGDPAPRYVLRWTSRVPCELRVLLRCRTEGR